SAAALRSPQRSKGGAAARVARESSTQVLRPDVLPGETGRQTTNGAMQKFFLTCVPESLESELLQRTMRCVSRPQCFDTRLVSTPDSTPQPTYGGSHDLYSRTVRANAQECTRIVPGRRAGVDGRH